MRSVEEKGEGLGTEREGESVIFATSSHESKMFVDSATDYQINNTEEKPLSFSQ